MMAKPETPEQRRRLLLPREPIFTAAMSGAEVQRRFLFRERLAFFFGVLLGLGAMWLMAFLQGLPKVTLRWPLFAGAVALFGISTATRLRSRMVQALTFLLGLVAFGAAAGTLVPSAIQSLVALLDASIMIGVVVLGCTLNTLLFSRERTPFVQFLLTGPWLVAASVAVYFLPAGEWELLASGATAVLLIFLLHQAVEKTLQTYTPREYVVAAADVIPLSLISAWEAFSGQG